MNAKLQDALQYTELSPRNALKSERKLSVRESRQSGQNHKNGAGAAKRSTILLKFKERLEAVEKELDVSKDEIGNLKVKIEMQSEEIAQKTQENDQLIEKNKKLFGKEN